jgi:hypothetical protein
VIPCDGSRDEPPDDRSAEGAESATDRANAASQPAVQGASPKVAHFDEAALLQKVLLSVPETAFLMRVGARTVWRLMADPKSGFPAPRRVRGRTLLARDVVLAFFRLIGRPRFGIG